MTHVPTQILVAYDFSDCSELALQHALNVALDERPRDFHFLVALDPKKGLGLRDNETIDYAYAEEVQKLATERISSAINNLKLAGEVSMLVHVRIGDPAAQILALAEEIGASLILLGSHGRTGVKRWLMGSVSEEVVREARCPVTVARERGYADVPRSHITEVQKSEEDLYVPPHRFHYTSRFPTQDKVWALY